jgi:hypothetical protein
MVNRRTLAQSLQKHDLREVEIAFVAGELPQSKENNGHLQEQPVRNVHEDARVEPPTSGRTVSLTFRLPEKLATALLETSLKRKLRRAKPYTQQDILAEALAFWLKNQAASL